MKRGDTIVFLPAAGGVGLLFGQWAKALGAKTIASSVSDDKVEIAKAHGYSHVINSRKEDVSAKVKRNHRRKRRAGL